MTKKNYTIQVRIHTTREHAHRLANLISDYTHNEIGLVDAAVVLCLDDGTEVDGLLNQQELSPPCEMQDFLLTNKKKQDTKK